MHEYSLIRSLLSQVTDILHQHDGEAVEVIRVEMGPLSGVERQLVEIAYDQQIEDTPCCGAELQIQEIPLTAVCRSCGVDFQVHRFRFACTDCGSDQVRVTGGDEFRLLDVQIRCSSESNPQEQPL